MTMFYHENVSLENFQGRYSIPAKACWPIPDYKSHILFPYIFGSVIDIQIAT